MATARVRKYNPLSGHICARFTKSTTRTETACTSDRGLNEANREEHSNMGFTVALGSRAVVATSARRQQLASVSGFTSSAPRSAGMARKQACELTRREVLVHASDDDTSDVKYNKEFGYSRKDVILIGFGLIGGGFFFKWALEAAGVDPIMAGTRGCSRGVRSLPGYSARLSHMRFDFCRELCSTDHFCGTVLWLDRIVPVQGGDQADDVRCLCGSRVPGCRRRLSCSSPLFRRRTRCLAHVLTHTNHPFPSGMQPSSKIMRTP